MAPASPLGGLLWAPRGVRPKEALQIGGETVAAQNMVVYLEEKNPHLPLTSQYITATKNDPDELED